MAQTDPYPRSSTPFDHLVNAIVVSPDGTSLYVNSGSRTDHGEVQANEGTFPDTREVPLTSAILRLPADTNMLLLPNDEDALEAGGYLFAEGVRNTFALAFDAEGRLFGSENSGDRDDGDELNWIREGFHYGFPWRMGLNDTPQRFPGFDPDLDPLINPASTSYQSGFFYDDPSYPPPPASVTFTDPIRNTGPDADLYRNPTDGTVQDASTTGVPFATFTPHRSPLGLVFDAEETMPMGYTGDGFVLSWTDEAASPLLQPFGDQSQDLLHLRLNAARDEVAATRLVGGFRNPIDAVLLGQTLYVVEFDSPNGLWAVTISKNTAIEEETSALPFTLDVFPNPFVGEARVRVQLHQPQHVRLEIFDLLGRRIAALHEGELPAGEHTFAFEASDQAVGAYVIRTTSDQGLRTQLLTLVRN